MLTRASLRITIITAAVGLVGCASLRGHNNIPSVPITVEVNNNITNPIDFSVYAVRQGGTRKLLGNVPPGKQKTFSFTPVTYSEPYRLMAIGPSGRALRSYQFTVGSAMTDRIIWTMSPNIVGFENADTDTTVTSP